MESGATLSEVKVAWESCGLEKPENDNVVFVCHALTGDAHVAGIRPGETEPSGWWEGMVGPGRAIDTNHYRVICANVFGGCKGTTGPSSVNPATGKPYGSTFPHFTIGDTVEVYRAFLREIGVNHLACLIGGSFGGMQVLEWITAHPGEVERAVMIASGSAVNAQALAFDVIGRHAITRDPNWRGGDYYDSPAGGPAAGLGSARQMAHITYLSIKLLNEKFGRKVQQSWIDKGEDFLAEHDRLFGTTFQIESYLNHQAAKFIERFDANSYLHLTQALDRYDASVKYGSLSEVAKRIKTNLLLVSLSGDWLFDEDQSRDIVKVLLAAEKPVSYVHLDVKVGHDGFLTHIKELSRVVGGFLSPRTPNLREWEKRRLAPVVDMVKDSSRVLDIGCGRGKLLSLLRTEKRVVGTGIEIDFSRIARAIANDNNVVFEDADAKLALIPDHSYDMVILSETLQAVKRPRELLRQILRVADEAVVAFPNFASISVRAQLFFRGHMPVGKNLPFEWYDTPNIHLFTYADFKALCKAEGIELLERYAEGRGFFGRLLVSLGFVNLGSERVICRIGKKK